MSNKNDSNNKLDSAFDADISEVNGDNSESKAKHLIEFIENVKENAAYINEQPEVRPNEEEGALSSTENNDDEEKDADINVDTKKAKDDAPIKVVVDESILKTEATVTDENTATIEETVSNENTEQNIIEETDEAKVEIKKDKPNKGESQNSSDLKETGDFAQKGFDESAFNAGFNPTFAFYDGDDSKADVKDAQINEPMQKVQPEENISDPIEPSADIPVAQDTAIAEVEESLETPTFSRLGKKAIEPDTKNTHKKSFSLNAISTKEDKPKEKPESDQNAKSKKSFTASIKAIPKKVAIGIVAAVLLVAVVTTGGVMAAKGMIPAFASNEIYGIFVNGELVAATQQEGQIEEAIDDFLVHYKTLEEQGSIQNLRISSPYEIRELTREEIKEKIYSEKNTSKASTTTPEISAPSDNSEQNSQNGESTTQTTAATTQGSEDTDNTTHATTNQSNPLNKQGDLISTSQSIDDLKNVLFYGSAPKPYTIVEGDNLSKIAKREGLTLTELMVPNPDLLEDSTLGIDQEILIVKMAGSMKLSFSREVTYTEDVPFETVEEKTEDLFEGEKQTTQQGKEGIKQDVTKYDYENNVIAVKTPISDETIAEPVKKIVKIGTKKKTSPEQSSGVTDSGEGEQQASTSGYAWPVNGARMTSKFGPRKAPKRGASSYHRGWDLAISSGTPIYATQSGTVTIAAYSGGYGNLVEVNHGGGMTSRYGHCLSLKVKRGEKVQKGQLIALVGNTGVSTGPHVHFEIRKNGTAVNPANYLK